MSRNTNKVVGSRVHSILNHQTFYVSLPTVLEMADFGAKLDIRHRKKNFLFVYNLKNIFQVASQ